MTPRIIVTDMDGTLLDPKHRIPDSFWPLLEEMNNRGIIFAPASGRQLYTLKEQFGPRVRTFLAENGTMVEHNGVVVSTTPTDPEVALEVISIMESHPQVGAVVLCRTDGAFFTDTSPVFLEEIARYYHRRTQVENLTSLVNENVIKLAIYTFNNSETTAAPLLRETGGLMSISGPHWIDIYNPAANKGRALSNLAASLGVDMADTVAFGDYLNDVELLQVAGQGIAVANAHPNILALADEVIDSHEKEGVITKIRALLDTEL